jgi:hypothetical protein
MVHEDLQRAEAAEGSSDRSFGLVFAVVSILVGFWPLLGGAPLRWWALGVAGAFLLVSLVRPALLAGPNRAWTKLGLLLGKIVSPVALGVLFFAVFAPLGFLFRLAGKDPLRLNRDPGARSYWIPREPPGPPPESMTNQF